MQPIEVYYDGLCPLCSREVNWIRRLAPSDQMHFVDILGEGFDPKPLGLDREAIHRNMHVRDCEGRMQVGLDALITMWRPVPYFRWLARFASLPIIYRLSKVGYWAFALIRPWLPKRKYGTDTCSVK